MDEQTKRIINKCLIEIKNRNKKYIDILYYLISHKLKHIALRHLKNEEDAKDVEQDFWADIYKNADNFKYINNGYSYLCKIMTYMSINRYKKLYGERQHMVEEVATSYIEPFNENIMIEKLNYKLAVQKAWDSLEPLEHAVMDLIIYEDKTITQISKDLKLSKSKVGRIKLLAEEKLKKELTAMGFGKNRVKLIS